MREAERQRGIAARPPAPDWLIERGLSRRNHAESKIRQLDTAASIGGSVDLGVPKIV